MSLGCDEAAFYMYQSMNIIIAEMDVSKVADGIIVNVNKIPIDRIGDFGIDNKKEIYVFLGKNKWRHI